MSQSAQEPPQAYQAFVKRYPKLGRAWELAAEVGGDGPLDEKTVRLVKLAIAIGALREGAVHSSVRKAVSAGVSPQAIEQVVGLAATTLGFPSAVAVYCWVQDVTGNSGGQE